ncbi:ABC transporter substrate-binding protein [bacterium]|nr:ABC transporter substrate-binding protein [bacterium]
MSNSRNKSNELKILLSRMLTRSGDQAWDFAIPICLVSLFPSQFSLVAFLYLVSKLGSFVFQPWLAGIIDRWKRLNTAALGTGLQLVSVVLVTACIFRLSQTADPQFALWRQPHLWPVLFGIALGTVVSNLGSGLMDIAVGKDWIPVLVSKDRLPVINSRLQTLDLMTEVLSPVMAGLILAHASHSRDLTGLAIIAAWNVVSFVPEILLLRSVFESSSLLREIISADPGSREGLVEKTKLGWSKFIRQSTAPVMIANAFLWLSALSPHGVLLTGFLKSGWNLPETTLGIFRGLGAVFGLLATVVFPWFHRRLGLVPATRLFIVFQALVVLLSFPFFYTESAGGLVFLALILLSRIGLYGFCLGETEIRQRWIPQGQRGQVNGVAGALTSFATLVLFGLGSLLGDKNNFIFMIVISICSVLAGAVLFLRWSLVEHDSAQTKEAAGS